jgi:hypothetical protein
MAYIYDLTDTWNAGGTTFNAIKMNVTDSASASASKLVTLQTNGTEHFSVTKGGQGYFSGNLGIGTASPSAFSGYTSLTVSNGANGGLIEATNGTRTIRMQSQATGSAFIGTPTNHALGLITASVERVTLDTNGNLGIGTTAPTAKLDIRGNMNLIGTSGVASTTLIGAIAGVSNGYEITQTSGNLISHQWRLGDNNPSMLLDSAGNLGIGTTSPSGYGGKLSVVGTIACTDGPTLLSIRTASQGTSLGAYHASGAHIAFQTTPNGGGELERMRLDASGNVMVGTTSANSKFLVTYSNPTTVPAAGAGGHCAAFGTVGYGLAAGAITNGNAYLQATRWDTLATNYDLLLQPNGGNVGIGTASPSTSLDVATAGNRSGGNIYIGSKANNFTKYTALVSTQYAYDAEPEGFAMIATQSSSTSENSVRIGGYIGELNAATDVIFYTAANTTTRAGTERARIDASGNLLVGTTTNPYSARVRAISAGADTFQAVQPSAGGYNFASDAFVNGGAYYHMWFGESGTQRGSITSNGSNVSYNTSSDYRLKDIDGPIANSGAYIDALKPVQGSWKADGSRFIGLLAHEAQEVSETQIATGEKDGEEMQAMDYSAPEIIANLIAELQSLRARVAQLEGN